jgi:DNA-binding NarL/FixJ family response regulator
MKDRLLEMGVSEELVEGILGLMEEEREKERKEKKKGMSDREEQVYSILMRGKPVSISDIGNEIGIKDKNVSSYLSYLKNKWGVRIGTDEKGRKIIMGG